MKVTLTKIDPTTDLDFLSLKGSFKPKKTQSVIKIQSPLLRQRWQKQNFLLKKKLSRKPSQKILFHLTDLAKAHAIIKKGFRIELSRNRAFGKGMHFCETAQATMKYSRKGRLKLSLFVEFLSVKPI